MASPLGIEFGAVYEIVGPLGDRAVINDPSDPDFVGYTEGDDAVTGLERAANRANVQPLAGEDGEIHGRFLRGGLAFTIKGLVWPDAGASQALQDKLLRATDAADAEATLLWTPSSGESVHVRFREAPGGATRITGRRPKRFVVAGVSQDPSVYSAGVHEVEILPPPVENPGGFSSPLASPLTSTPDPQATAAIVNAGRRKTWPVLEIEGPCTNPEIVNATLGLRLALTYTLAAGETLVLDSHPRRRTIYLNGDAAQNRYGALDWGRSVWWPLVPETNLIQFGYASSSAGAKARVRWRDAWG